MGAIKRNIPNFITCLNLACGCLGILAISYHQEYYGIYFLLVALIFDFFDGFVARILKVTSKIGKDLDSLADIVTFGLLPTIMFYNILHHAWYISNGVKSVLMPSYSGVFVFEPFTYPSLAVLLVIFSALRLARFNNDEDQGYYFKGLATPACGLFVASIYYYHLRATLPGGPEVNIYFLAAIHWLIQYPACLIIILLLLCFLLVAPIKLMAFKFKGFGWKQNQWKYILLIVCLPLAIWLGFASAPIILILYILISQIHFRNTPANKVGESMSTNKE